MTTLLKDLQEFVALSEAVELIVESEADWKTKYDLVFSPRVSGHVRSLGIDFEWYDLDESYQQDVENYAFALAQKAREVRKVIESLKGEPFD